MKKLFLLCASCCAVSCASPGQTIFGTTEVTAQIRQDKVDLHTLLDPLNRREPIMRLSYKNYKDPNSPKTNTSPTRTMLIDDSFFESFNKPLSEKAFKEVVETEAAFVAFYTYGIEDEKCIASDEEIIRKLIARSAKPDEIKHILNSEYLATRRNTIQQRIIAASNEQCQQYKIRLSKNATHFNFGFDAATIALAGLGSIFTDPTTVRSLAGAAAITAGVGDAYRARYFESRTVHIINDGIDVARANKLRDIYRKSYGAANSEHSDFLAKNSFFWEQFDIGDSVASLKEDLKNAKNTVDALTNKIKQGGLDATALKKAKEDLEKANKELTAAEAALKKAKAPSHREQIKLASIYQYTIEAALADAIEYHAKCSLAAGLDEAAKSVADAKSPSLESATKMLENISKFQAQLLKIAPSSRAPAENDGALKPDSN